VERSAAERDNTMGAHKRRSKNGLPRISRTERKYRTRALHEAAHAVLGEALGIKVDCVQIFTESDVNDRRVMKMSGCGGFTMWCDIGIPVQVWVIGPSEIAFKSLSLGT
jgi:hypothetical protein